jgi:hypothetical protein
MGGCCNSFDAITRYDRRFRNHRPIQKSFRGRGVRNRSEDQPARHCR